MMTQAVEIPGLDGAESGAEVIEGRRQLMVRGNREFTPGGLYPDLDMNEVYKFCRTAAASKVVSSTSFTPEDVMIIVLAGREFGLSPLAALMNGHVIKGKFGMSADMMAAVAIKKGAQIELTETTEETATHVFTGCGRKTPLSFTFDKDMATRAGLWKDDDELKRLGYREGTEQHRKYIDSNWYKYPGPMLRARSLSQGIRAAYPGLISGAYLTDELVEIVDVVEAPPAAPASTPAAPTKRSSLGLDGAAGQQDPPAGGTPTTGAPPPDPEPNRADCAVCGKNLTVTKSGGLYQHKGEDGQDCPGSGQAPGWQPEPATTPEPDPHTPPAEWLALQKDCLVAMEILGIDKAMDIAGTLALDEKLAVDANLGRFAIEDLRRFKASLKNAVDHQALDDGQLRSACLELEATLDAHGKSQARIKAKVHVTRAIDATWSDEDLAAYHQALVEVTS